ncbi:MAG: phage baseplate assembly protein [Thermodesulfovibrionales bacterium]|nr:phage baseplate assembly protein [Thermodesulfovibrionales bacterium]
MKLVRGIISAIVAEAGKLMRFGASGRPDETFTNREVFQNYGFSSRPKAGAEAIILMDGNVIYVIAEDDSRYRIALEDGEVALYNNEGVKVHLKQGKKVEVSGADEINLGGDRATLRQLIDERFKTLFDAHFHSGVATGTSNSGPPTVPLDLLTNATATVRAK